MEAEVAKRNLHMLKAKSGFSCSFALSGISDKLDFSRGYELPEISDNILQSMII